MATLYLVGDSTMCYYDLTVEDTSFALPRNGYGTWLARNFNGSIFIKNLALSGRSSKSFLTEDNYSHLKNNIKEGDFLVIGFGHNDQKFNDESRFTFGGGDITDPRSFKYSIYNYYIKLAQSVGATPILCTSICRRSPENEYKGDRIHSIGRVTCGGETFKASDYAKAIRELAKEFNLTLIDMTKATSQLYKKLGAKENVKFHATLSNRLDHTDNTHLNSYGAGVLANLWCSLLKKTDSPLKKYLVKSFYTPSYERDLIKN